MTAKMTNPVWFEIAIHSQKTLDFYQKVFGWQFKKTFNAAEKERKEMWHINTPDKQVIGAFYIDDKLTTPRGVEIYFHVDNVDETLKNAIINDGCVDLDKTSNPLGNGFYGRMIDPDGNIVGIWSPH